NHARPIGFGQRDGIRVALVPPLEVGGLPLAGRQLQAQDVEVVVEVAIEIEAPDLHDPQPRDSVRHLVPLPAWHRPARPLFTRLACPAEPPHPTTRPTRTVSPSPAATTCSCPASPSRERSRLQHPPAAIAAPLGPAPVTKSAGLGRRPPPEPMPRRT